MFAKASAALAAVAFVQQLGSASAQSSSTYSADLSTSTACPAPGGVHVIIARGSLETPPYGVQVVTKDKILAMIPGSTADGTIGYPNTLDDYFNSATDGAIVARGLITDFVARCPNSPLFLSGYSQGANVLGDALIGQMDRSFPDNTTIDQPLPDSTLSQVAGLVLIGDPTYVTMDAPFNVGNASMNGSFPRQNSELFFSTGLAAKARAYCNADDLFCAGGQSLAVHVSYFPGISDNLVAFAVKQVAAWYAANPAAASGSAASTGMASTTPMPASASASVAASVSRSLSACLGKSTGGVMSTGGATMSRATASSVASPTASSTSAGYTGGASTVGMSVAGMGAVVAGLFAAML